MNKQTLFSKIFKNLYIIDATYFANINTVRYIPVIYDETTKNFKIDKSKQHAYENPYFFKGTIVGIRSQSNIQLNTFIDVHKTIFIKSLYSKFDDEDDEYRYGLGI